MRKKILLVDDSKVVLMLETLFLRSDYDIITAADGRAAVARALAEPPALVVLDLVMPGMNGLQVCRALRRAEATKSTPIVMLSSQNSVSSRKACYLSGCTVFVSKPVDGPKLLAQVRGLLNE
jgi:CheY-like chemotaxis protein